MVAAIVLAAGAGSRFAGPAPKVLAPFRGRPLAAHALDAAAASGLALFVVTGGADVSPLLPAGAAAVVNPDPRRGQASSVQLGIAAAREAGHDAVVVGLADQPLVATEAWRLLAAAPAEPPIAVATYCGRRGNPVRLAEAVWPLLPVTGDAVGRWLMAERPELVREIPCPGDPADVDTVEDLDRWS